MKKMVDYAKMNSALLQSIQQNQELLEEIQKQPTGSIPDQIKQAGLENEKRGMILGLELALLMLDDLVQ